MLSIVDQEATTGNSLAARLEELVNSSLLTETQLDVLLAGIRRLSGAGVLEDALAAGDRAPDFRLTDQHGKEHSLSAQLADGPVVLQFFRGDWCPFCQAQLKALNACRAGIAALGARLLCISPQDADKHIAMQAEHGLELLLLSDPGGAVSHAYRIAHDLDEAERSIYAELGIEVPRSAAGKKEFLPLPASYVIQPDGLISYSHVEVDFRRRPEPLQLLAELQSDRAGSQN